MKDKKHYDTASCIYKITLGISENDSLLFEKSIFFKASLLPEKVKYTKLLPTIFFTSYLIVVCFTLFHFIPYYYNMTISNTNYEKLLTDKFKIGFFSRFVNQLDQFTKVNLYKNS
jgi:hypothetical protein